MKTDSIWYHLFLNFPSIFFELAGQPPSLADSYSFTSVEIKQLAFRLDGVFLPTADTPSLPICFCEVQFQEDDHFYSRLFTEIFIYLRQKQPPNDWQATILYPNRTMETSPPDWYREFFVSGRVQRVYLDELVATTEPTMGIGTAQLIVGSQEGAGDLARKLIAQARANIVNSFSQQKFVELIETILVYKLPSKSREEIEAMLGLSELKQTKVYQEAKLEGLQQGHKQAMQEIARKLLLQGTPQKQITALTGLDRAELQRLNTNT
ncbi:MAG: Rpn family recombination-promoting nuclease/putative transposase [Prochloron sp. SP5CPC1]|nr:Rpn family recombination-promoting nuclease/putative transposase [Candidatus Paraprochloron terpiosi SP5CPC1]